MRVETANSDVGGRPERQGGESPGWRRLREAINGLVVGDSVEATLESVLLHAENALPAAGHRLDVHLSSRGRHVRDRGGCGRMAHSLGVGRPGPVYGLIDGVHVVSVAVATASTVYGVLAAIAPDGGRFAAGDDEILATYARHAAALIEMAELLEAAHEEERTARLLLNVARSLAGRQSETDICRVVAEAVPRLLGADRGVVMLWDEKTGDVRVVGQHGWPPQPGRRSCSSVAATTNDSPELWQLLATGNPVLVDHRSSVWTRRMLSHFGLVAAAAVPMMFDGTLAGVIVAAWVDTSPPAVLHDAASERLYGLASLAAVTLDNTRLLEEIRHHVSHDGLTELPNRQLFEVRLQRELTSGQFPPVPVAVIFGNVSRLKRVNDGLGHSAGDELLRHVARRLRSVVREQDTVARYSGDEFAVLLPGTDRQGAENVADRIRAALTPPMRLGGNEIYAELTLGIAADGDAGSARAGRDGAETARRLVEEATNDVLSTRARTRGHANTGTPSADRLRLETELHGAVSRGEIAVHFQAQIDVADGTWVGVEALARWEHPTLGSVSPGIFVPLAEESGLIDEIGQHVLRVACHTIAGWRREGLVLEVAVNVSAVQLTDPGFAALVERVVEETGLPPAQLTIEVTESQVLTEVASRQGHLEHLRHMGIGISVDDFGTGYSSLAQLHRLPVTEMKIDRSLIDQLTAEQSSVFAAGIVGLGHGLGLRVVAEGVESGAQLTALRQLGCDRAQGFLISRPLEPETLRAVMVGVKASPQPSTARLPVAAD